MHDPGVRRSGAGNGRFRRLAGLLTAAFLTGTAVFAVVPGADAAPGDIGFEGPTFTGMSSPATSPKPQSKLWYNDGIWWADLWDTASSRHEIWRLDVGSQTWQSTDVALDARSSSRTDVLWSGSKLYVSSTPYTSSPGSGGPSYLFRYSYNASSDQYSLDAGFPSQINNLKTETLVIDRDSFGKLWATWTNSSPRQVYVATSSNDGATWGAPFVPAVGNAAQVDADDISSLVAFGGNKIGLMWSNQRLDTMYFSVHNDGAVESAWGAAEAAYSGTNRADDHINLKADNNGRVFAAIKTSTNPLTVLLRRNADSTWSSATFGTSGDSHTRPIVVLDTAAQVAHMFATCPQPPASSGQSGGDICEKTSPMNGNLALSPSGIGTPVIRWLAGSDTMRRNINDATSTKQNVSGSTGLVVLASIGYTRHYWHHYAALGGGGPVAPVANFNAAPTTGTGSLTVNFTDTSTNTPTSWAWDFQNNGSTDSTAQNPSFTYTAPGTYSVKLTATNGAGPGTVTKNGLITVTGTSGGTLTFIPDADAWVSGAEPSTNFGLDTQLRVRGGSSTPRNAYLRFNVSGLTGPATAKLRVFVTQASTIGGGTAYTVSDTTWSETGIIFTNAPAVGSPLSTVGPVSAGVWVEFDLGTVTTNGLVSFAIKRSGSTEAVYYSSREGVNAPQLVLTQ